MFCIDLLLVTLTSLWARLIYKDSTVADGENKLRVRVYFDLISNLLAIPFLYFLHTIHSQLGQ